MGYYTSYSLQCYGPEDKIKAFEDDLLKRSEYNGEVDGDLEQLVNDGYVNAKLYDLVGWIAEIAPKHPDVLVCLSGDGEESDDMWEERWKGDEEEFQKAIIPPFENNNLQIPNNK